MTIKLFNAIKVSILAIVLSFGLSYALAWTAPTATPPTGNVSAPINTSTTLQQKSGDLTVKNLVADMVNVGLPLNANAITAPKFCIGASCITAWTQAGAVTRLVAGTNITLTPAGGTGTVTVNAVGSTSLYKCPFNISCGDADACRGQLQTGATCTRDKFSGGGDSCVGEAVACPYAGKLMP